VTRVTPLLRAVLLGVLLLGIGWLMLRLRAALTPVLFALLVSYALDPLVDVLESWGMPRPIGIAFTLACVILLLALFVFLVLPSVVSDLFELVRTLAIALGRLVEYLRPWLASHGVELPPSVDAALANLSSNALSLLRDSLAPMGDVVSAAVGGTMSLIGTVGTLVMVPVFSFYFLHDFDRIMLLWQELLPRTIRSDVVSLAKQVDSVLSHFVRGQLTVMGIMGGLYALGYTLIGVTLAVPIGLLAGILTFVPYVGSTVALVLGLLMVLVHFSGWGQIVAVASVYLTIQILDGLVITPRVVGGKLGLSVAWVLFALMAFGQLFGFVGVMLALPASAVIKVFVLEGLTRYRRSSFYMGERSTPSTPTYRQAARLRLRRGHRDRVRFGPAP
jgi:predicted PurR-regulated permease PerM